MSEAYNFCVCKLVQVVKVSVNYKPYNKEYKMYIRP